MVWRACSIDLTTKQQRILEKIYGGSTSRQDHYCRAQIILLSASGMSNTKISRALDIRVGTASKWRNRWHSSQEMLLEIENNAHITAAGYQRVIEDTLSDQARSGAPPKFTAEQVCQIIALSCEKPEDSGLPISHWSLSSLKQVLEEKGIVDSISKSKIGAFLK